jgi:hypothetical protein
MLIGPQSLHILITNRRSLAELPLLLIMAGIWLLGTWSLLILLTIPLLILLVILGRRSWGRNVRIRKAGPRILIVVMRW